MKIKLLAFVCLLLSPTFALAQSSSSDSTETEIVDPWTKSWVLSLKGNQANYQDWSIGGINSSAFVTASKFNVKYSSSKFSNTLRSDLRFGQVYQKGSGAEKTQDLILISNKIDYFINSGVWSAFLEVSFRTQFTKGFNGEGTMISDFLSPGYLVESLGISYQPSDNFNF